MTLAALVFSVFAGVFPMHGTVLGNGPHGTLVVRNDPVTQTLSAQTRAYHVTPAAHYDPGEGIDAFVDSRRPQTLFQARPAARFAPGQPDPGKVSPVDYGTLLPQARVVDQTGRLLDLASAFGKKVVLVSFVFTRCPDKDECPAIAAKFAYLQNHLDAAHFHLVLISLDPVYDSPAVLAHYGNALGADPNRWSIVTGQPQDIQHVLDRFGISSLRVGDANFIHSDKVFVADPRGKVAEVVQTAAFSPASLAAEARHVAGLESNPLGRLQLALVADAVALCGGSQFAGIVLLETLLFLAIAGVSFVALGLLARYLARNP